MHSHRTIGIKVGAHSNFQTGMRIDSGSAPTLQGIHLHVNWILIVFCWLKISTWKLRSESHEPITTVNVLSIN